MADTNTAAASPSDPNAPWIDIPKLLGASSWLGPSPGESSGGGMFGQLGGGPGGLGTNPGIMALLGAARGMGAAAMPTRFKGGTPMGAAIGMAAGGAGEGVEEAYKAQLAQGQAQLLQAQLPYLKQQYDWMNQMYRMPPEQLRRIFGLDGSGGGSTTGVTSSPSAGATKSASIPAIGTGGPGSNIPVPPEYLPFYDEASQKTGVPASVLIAKDRQESGFNPGATGTAGEIGIAQISPKTATTPGYGMQGVSNPAVLRDPRTNILFGAQYLAARNPKTNWQDPAQVADALRAYNGGGDPNYAANVMRYLPKGYGGAPGTPGTVQTAQAGNVTSDVSPPLVPPPDGPGGGAGGGAAVPAPATGGGAATPSAGAPAAGSSGGASPLVDQFNGQAAQLEQRAKVMEFVSRLPPGSQAPFAMHLGVPLEDPAMLRQQAQMYRQKALELQTAGPVEAAKLQEQMRAAYTLARQKAMGENVTVRGVGAFVQTPNGVMFVPQPTEGSITTQEGATQPAFYYQPPPGSPPGTPGSVSPVVGTGGQPVTSKLSPEQQEEAQSEGKRLSGLRGEVVNQARESANAHLRIQQVQTALAAAKQQGIGTGYFSPELAQAAAAAKSLGIDTSTLGIDPKAIGNVQAANEALVQISGEILKRLFPQRITNMDVKLYGESLPHFGMDPAALDQVLKLADAAATYDTAKSNSMLAYESNHGHSLRGWESEFYDKHGYGPQFWDAVKPAIGGASSTAAPGLPPEAIGQLKEGKATNFGNGQAWTLKQGQPVRIK